MLDIRKAIIQSVICYDFAVLFDGIIIESKKGLQVKNMREAE
jgi:hypothetical protein